MRKLKYFGFILVFLTNLVYADASPLPMLENSTSNIISTLKHNQESLKNDPKIVNQAINVYLLPHVDIQGMSRSVLGRQIWNNITVVEKREFIDAFTKLVIRTYAVPLSEYSGETVKFRPIRGDIQSKFTQVDSIIIRPNGQKIPLSYSLVKKQDGWKVYDLSVDGVSLLQSFRSQFNESLKTVSMKELIKQLNQTKKAA